MSEFKYQQSLVGEEFVTGTEGYKVLWNQLEEALKQEGHMPHEEEVFQIGVEDDGVALMVRKKEEVE